MAVYAKLLLINERVIPAKAGVHWLARVDSRFHGACPHEGGEMTCSIYAWNVAVNCKQDSKIHLAAG